MGSTKQEGGDEDKRHRDMVAEENLKIDHDEEQAQSEPKNAADNADDGDAKERQRTTAVVM